MKINSFEEEARKKDSTMAFIVAAMLLGVMALFFLEMIIKILGAVFTLLYHNYIWVIVIIGIFLILRKRKLKRK